MKLPPNSRIVNEFDDYAIDSDGCLWSRRPRNWQHRPPIPWRRLKGKYKKIRGTHKGGRRRPETNPHLYADIIDNNGVFHRKWLHRLVLEAFVGPCPKGMESRHLNDVGTDNRFVNLSWGTHVQNTADKAINGKLLFGEKHANSTLKEADILEIRRLAREGVNRREIAKRFGFKKTYAITRIVYGETWKQTKGALPARKLTAKQRSDSCRHAALCRWGKKPKTRTKKAS